MRVMNKNPLIDPGPVRLIGISFSILNLTFLLRLIWVLIKHNYDIGTSVLLITVILIQVFFVISGFYRNLVKKMVQLLSIPGIIFFVFFSFSLIKKGVKLILISQTNFIRSEIGTWFLSLFLWLTCLIIIQSIRELLLRIQTKDPNPSSNKFASRILLLGFIFILSLMIGFWLYTQLINPLPIYSYYDPEYSYMLNSLTPFKDLELYRRMDHPGTFMQILGSIIAVILSPLTMLKGGYPYQYHINHPDTFLLLARLIVILMNSSVLYLLYKQLKNPRKWSDALAGVCILIAYFAAHKMSFKFLTIWSPNSFNFSIGTAILLVLYKITTQNEKIDHRTLWMFSVATGLAATFHIYMISLIVGSISTIFFLSFFENRAWVPALKSAGKFILGSVIGYISGTLIILPYYGDFLQWIINIITHQETYGTGVEGFPSLASIFQNIQVLWRSNLSLFLIWGFSVFIFTILWVFRKNSFTSKYRIWAFVIGINIQIISLIIIIGKHPGDRYLLSIASICPLLFLSIYDLINEYQLTSKVLFGLTLGLLLVSLSINVKNNIDNHADTNRYLDSYQSEIDDFISSYSQENQVDPGQVTIYWTYNTFSPCYSLWLGNDFSKKRFTDEIGELCPNDLQFDVWDRTITGSNLNGLEALRNQQEHSILIGDSQTIDNSSDFEFTEVVDSQYLNLGFIIIH